MTVAQLILALLRQDPARAVYVQGRAGQTLIARTIEGTPRLDILEITGTKVDDPGTPEPTITAGAIERIAEIAAPHITFVAEPPAFVDVGVNEPEPELAAVFVDRDVPVKRKPGRPKKVK